MNYELVQLHELIKQITRVDNAGSASSLLSQEEREVLLHEAERVKTNWLQTVFSATTETAQRRYVQSHQYFIIRFCDEVDTAGSTPGTEIIYDVLEDLYLFLEKHFTDLIDLDVLVNRACFKKFLHALAGLLAALESKASGVNAELFQFAIGPLKKVAALDDQQGITAEELVTLKMQAEQLTLLLRNVHVSDIDLIECLLKANVSNTHFYDFCQTFINEELYKTGELQERINVLVNFIHRFQSMRIMESPLHFESLRDRLVTWLQMEIKETQEEIDEWNLADVDKDDELGRLETSLNVKELALMIRLSFAAAVFVNQDVKKLIKLISLRVTTVATNERKNISAKHLYNAMYRYTDATIETVERLVARMFEQFQGIKRKEFEKRGIGFKKVKKEIWVYQPETSPEQAA